MNDVYLQISMTMPLLDFESSPAQLDIRQPRPRLEVIRHKGSVKVESRHPRLEIDGEAARAMEGRKSTAQLIREAAQQALLDVRDAAAQYNAAGNAQARSAARGKLARANAARPHFRPSGGGIGYVPFELPHFQFTDNSFHYSAEPDRLEYRWSVYPMAQVRLTRETALHIRVKRYGAVHIQLVRRRLDVRA